VTLDMIILRRSLLFVIILALLGIVLLFVRCMIHCKHLQMQMQIYSYLFTYLLAYVLLQRVSVALAMQSAVLAMIDSVRPSV